MISELFWTNCWLFLTGLNEPYTKKCDKKKYSIIDVAIRLVRLILITLYVHLTANMFALSLMGIYVKHKRLPLIIWYYYATVQTISALQWYIMSEMKSRNHTQLKLMTEVIVSKRRKFIRFFDLLVSGSIFIIFTSGLVAFPLFNLLTKNLDNLIDWFTTKSPDNTGAYVHKFIIPCSEISSMVVVISSKLYVSFFHIHFTHVAKTLKEKISGLNSENKERLIKRFLEWITRRNEAVARFSPLIFLWSLSLVVNILARNINGFDKTARPELFPLKIMLLLFLFLFFGYSSNLSQKSFIETTDAAIKYLNNKENNNRVQVGTRLTYESEENLKMLDILKNEIIEPTYILSIFKCNIFEINSNLPFKLFLTFLLLHLIPSMFWFQ